MNRYDAGEIRALFERGENIIEWVVAHERAAANSETAILYSYDVQAGSYVAALEDEARRRFNDNFGRRVATVLDELAPTSLLDAGVGEATSLAPVLRHMAARPAHVLGFDLSLSRLLYAHRHLDDQQQGNVALFTGALERIPLASASADVVLTMHAVEPNHGREADVLRELLRVARRYLVMIEPSYELAPPEGRARMERLGYVRELPAVLERLGHRPHRIEAWPLNANPLNPAALIVVEKQSGRSDAAPEFVSPISGRALTRRPECWFCPDDGHAFPIIGQIPCLTIDSAILASKLGQF
ncbi:MAG: class I SAM-dependent methyltransferase [Hyphomicrobiales bacterium]|nr:class I SAM-dependent methyltransferase [Hyphomicrobiales bacterium]